MSLRHKLAGLGILLFSLLAITLSYLPEESAQAMGPTQTIAHAQGQSEIPSPPTRIVPFDLAALDILDALGAEGILGIGGAITPPSLARYAQPPFQPMGTLFEPDLEALHAAAPDLVVTGARSSAKYEALRAHFPTVDLYNEPANYLGALTKNVQLLATLLGKEDVAEARLERLAHAITELRAITADRGEGLLLLTTGGRLSAYGPGSRFGWIHTELGIPPAAEGLDTSRHGEAVHPEFILERDPAWIFVIDRDVAISTEARRDEDSRRDPSGSTLDNALIRQTRAWQQGQIVWLDPVDWYLVSGGLASTERMVQSIADAYAR